MYTHPSSTTCIEAPFTGEFVHQPGVGAGSPLTIAANAAHVSQALRSAKMIESRNCTKLSAARAMPTWSRRAFHLKLLSFKGLRPPRKA